MSSSADSNAVKPQNAALVSAALRLLAGRDMSRRDFIARLVDRDFSVDEAAQAADWCAAQGWLSESRYAEVVARRLSSRYSSHRVVQTLRQKGVAEEVSADVLASLSATDLNRARALWQRRFGEFPIDAAAKAKQIRYLQTRGFSSAVIKAVLTPE